MSRAISGWKCDTCLTFTEGPEPWKCPSCELEICEFCFDQYAHCRECAYKMSTEEMIRVANENGWDFE